MTTFYLDSAVLSEVEEACRWGWVSGVTTNPTLLSKGGNDPADALRRIAALARDEVFYQLTSLKPEDMLMEAARARALVGEKLVLKIPAFPAGFDGAARLARQGYACAITAIYSPAQAMAAEACGARYAILYFHRAMKLLEDGMRLVRESADVLEGSPTRLLAASLKTSEEVVLARRSGIQHLTAGISVLRLVVAHPLSEQSIRDFSGGAGI